MKVVVFWGGGEIQSIRMRKKMGFMSLKTQRFCRVSQNGIFRTQSICGFTENGPKKKRREKRKGISSVQLLCSGKFPVVVSVGISIKILADWLFMRCPFPL